MAVCFSIKGETVLNASLISTASSSTLSGFIFIIIKIRFECSNVQVFKCLNSRTIKQSNIRTFEHQCQTSGSIIFICDPGKLVRFCSLAFPHDHEGMIDNFAVPDLIDIFPFQFCTKFLTAASP